MARIGPRTRSRQGTPRKGVAAVEFACVLPLMALLLMGMWEVGRMVEVQQMLTNAAREGARQASTGTKDLTAVKATVVTYLNQKGLTFVNSSHVTVTSVSNTSISDPTAANQLDQFRVTVTIPFNSVRWILLKSITNVTNLTASADWYSMRDLPLTVSATIPTQ